MRRNDIDPVEPDELLYRRVPVSQQWCIVDGLRFEILPEAFKPDHRDTDGLSLYRARYVTPDELAKRGTSKAGYYVVGIRAQHVLDLGVSIKPESDEVLPGHVIIPEVTYANRKSDMAREFREKMTSIIQSCEGPFTPASLE